MKRIIKIMKENEYEDIPSIATHPNIEELILIFGRRKYPDEYLEFLRGRLRIIFCFEVLAFLMVIAAFILTVQSSY